MSPDSLIGVIKTLTSPAVLVRIVQTQGSTPRGVGAAMLVTQDTSYGSVGGGHLEYTAIADARKWLAAGSINCANLANQQQRPAKDIYPATATINHQYRLNASLGQCCGGKVELEYAWLTPTMQVPEWLSSQRQLPIVIFGAGHIGRALIQMLACLPCRVNWVDSREDEFARYTYPLPSSITQTLSDLPEAEVSSTQAGSMILIMTHSHSLDLELCSVALKRQDLAFIGLIGSNSKSIRFRRKLAARGITKLHRLVCPVGSYSSQQKEYDAKKSGGFNLIGSHLECYHDNKDPGIIALNICHQLMQHAYQRNQEHQQQSCVSPSKVPSLHLRRRSATLS